MAGTSYTRQSTLTDGDTITSALFNAEYNQLVTAFSYAASGTTGHQHDGGAGEGGNIEIIGDADFLNKLVVDSTNNRWGVFVQVSSAAVEQIRIQDGAIVPVTDNDIDLGTSTLEFKDGFFDGTIHVDTLDVDVNATIAGTLGVTGVATVGGLTVGSAALNEAELEILDGATVTTAELNALDGITAVVGELNALDIGSTAVGTAVASKAVILDSNKDYTGVRNLTISGELDAATGDFSGAIDVAGTANLDVVDIDGAVNMATTALVTGVLTTASTQVATGGITSGSNIVSDTDSTDDLGTTSVRWANLFVDGITATDQITATGFTGTLDGILGSGAAAAATLTTLNTSGAVNLNLTTDSTSSTSGALIIDGGVGVAKKLFVGTDLDVDGAATFNAGVIINESGIDADFRVETNGQGNIIFADGANDTLHVQCSATPSATVSGFMFASDQFFTSAGATASSNTQVRFYNTNGLVGSITVADSATAFNTSSDYRLKENVSYAWDATTRLKQLKPARFNFISDSSNTLLDGFLAHEVSDTVPNAVSGTKDAEIQENGDGYQSIDHSKLVPLLVKTIQELEARITTLEGA